MLVAACHVGLLCDAINDLPETIPYGRTTRRSPPGRVYRRQPFLVDREQVLDQGRALGCRVGIRRREEPRAERAVMRGEGIREYGFERAGLPAWKYGAPTERPSRPGTLNTLPVSSLPCATATMLRRSSAMPTPGSATLNVPTGRKMQVIESRSAALVPL